MVLQNWMEMQIIIYIIIIREYLHCLITSEDIGNEMRITIWPLEVDRC